MRRHVDKLVLLALFALLAFAVHEHMRSGAATAKPADHAARRAPPPSLDRATKFDLLFSAPELALP
jgi:hypothetical protein